MVLNRRKDLTDRGALSQTVLIFESVFVLLLGVLAGALLPDEIISKVHQLTKMNIQIRWRTELFSA